MFNRHYIYTVSNEHYFHIVFYMDLIQSLMNLIMSDKLQAFYRPSINKCSI